MDLVGESLVFNISSPQFPPYFLLPTSYFLLLTPSASVAAVRIYENKFSCMTHLAHFCYFCIETKTRVCGKDNLCLN